MAFTTGLNNYNTTKWLVNATAGLGTHTTIATALTSASSGDDIYIMPGTYTENLTLKAGVNLIAYNTDSSNGTVTIIGKCSASFTGTANITGIRLQTNSAFLLELTGANVTVVNLYNCDLKCANNTGISSTGSNSSAQINCYQCTGSLDTTGIALYACTNGTLGLYEFVLNNPGGSTTANTFSGLVLTHKYCYMGNGTTTSGSTATFLAQHCYYELSASNATVVTSNSTSANNSTVLFNCYLASGSAVPMVVGSGSTIQCTGCTTFSSNSACITGAGTFNYGTLIQASTQGTISATTKSGFGTIANPTANAPTAGYIGEVLSASNTTGTAFSSGTIANISSVTLTPGIWDITGTLNFIPTGTMATNSYTGMAIATANNTLTPADDFGSGIGMLQCQTSAAVVVTATGCNLLCGPGRLYVSANTTYYLNGKITAGTTNCKGYGVIRAVRVA